MKLEKTWMGICVWVIYLVGMIFAIGVTGFVSGLFPFYDRYYVAAGTASISIIIAVIFGFLLNAIVQKVVTSAGLDTYEKPVWLEIIVPVAILIASFFAFGYSSSIVKDFTGNIDLYDSAVVAASARDIQLTSFSDKAYAVCLKVFMGFLGNSLNTAYVLHIILRTMLVLFLYIALRVVLGMIPAIIGSAAVIAIPSFGYTLKSVDSAQLTSTAIMFLLMVTVVYVYGFTRESSVRWYYKPISIVYGALLGFMIYFDAASAAVIAFLIAAWMLYDMFGETINICVNEIIVLISGVLAFGGMLIYEGGYDNIPDTYSRWTWRFYGYNENAWLLMAKGSQYNTFLALGLLIAAFIPAVLFFKKRCTKTSSFVMFSVLGLLASVILGDTVANSEIMIITFVVILICCGVAAMIHVKEDEPVAPAKNEDEENSEEEDNSEEEADTESDDELVVRPEITETPLEEELLPEEEEEPEEAFEEQQEEEAVLEQQEVVQEQQQEEQEMIETKKAETPRFVPEGMVLPMGEEDEEDLVPRFNMNRPEMEDIGILSVGGAASAKAAEKKEEPSSRKDDFDINIAPGDDFDI